MLSNLRRAAFGALKSSGLSAALARSSWRQKRLLILCYHGISTQCGVPAEDVHEWRPMLYMPQETLAARFRSIKDSGCAVLPLAEALRRLYAGSLPPKSVAITFDDGGYDFHRCAYPVVRDFGFPVTVYQTTYYADFPKPIFNLACSYLLWKKRDFVLPPAPDLGFARPVDLSIQANREAVVKDLIALSERNDLSGERKDELIENLASLVGVDYRAFSDSRLLQLMTPSEIAELSSKGVDFQLHTHRHRTPADELLFRKEIRDNRRRLEEITGRPTTHFCYPSGVYRKEFLPWLVHEGVTSATTCEPFLASKASRTLLLPRFVDTTPKSALEFEAWLDGTGSLLARQPRSTNLNQ